MTAAHEPTELENLVEALRRNALEHEIAHSTAITTDTKIAAARVRVNAARAELINAEDILTSLVEAFESAEGTQQRLEAQRAALAELLVSAHLGDLEHAAIPAHLATITAVAP